MTQVVVVQPITQPVRVVLAGTGPGITVSDDGTLASDSHVNPPSVHAVRVYTAAQVAAAVAAVVAAAPGALDTLNELAVALGNDANFSTTMTNLIATKAGKVMIIEPVTTTTYMFASADSYKHKRFTNAGAIAATIPKNSTDAIPIGTRIRITVAGAGQLTLTPEDVTVILNSRDNALKSKGQFSVLEIEKVNTNEWDVIGDVGI